MSRPIPNKDHDRLCTHCRAPDGLPVFPRSGGTDASRLMRSLMEIENAPSDELTVPSGLHTSNDSQSSGGSHPTHMTSLPTEMIENIINHLWNSGESLRETLRASARLHSITLDFMIKHREQMNARWPSRFRSIWYESTAESLATPKAVLLNPTLAASIEEIHVVTCAPHHLLSDEKKFKTVLRKTLEKDKHFRKWTEFEQTCAVEASFFEAREYFFEQLHMTSRGHDEETLKAAAPFLTALKTLKFTIHRSMTRSYCGCTCSSSSRSGCSYHPNFEQKVQRKPIETRMLHQRVEYRAFATAAKVLGRRTNVQSLSMYGVDVEIGLLPIPHLKAIGHFLSQIVSLELECGPDRHFGSSTEAHRTILKNCFVLFGSATAVKRIDLAFDRKWVHTRPKGKYTTFRYSWLTERPSELLSMILKQLHFPSLNHLELQWMELDPLELSTFITKHTDTLSHLLLARTPEYPEGRDGATWDSVLQHVRQSSKITHCYVRVIGFEEYSDQVVLEKGDIEDLGDLKSACMHSQGCCREHPGIRRGAVLTRWFQDYDMGKKRAY